MRQRPVTSASRNIGLEVSLSPRALIGGGRLPSLVNQQGFRPQVAVWANGGPSGCWAMLRISWLGAIVEARLDPLFQSSP
jgi:hypothetical protein